MFLNILKNFRVKKLVKLIIIGSKTTPAPAGDGTPSKKFIFHESAISELEILNLANLSAQQTV